MSETEVLRIIKLSFLSMYLLTAFRLSLFITFRITSLLSGKTKHLRLCHIHGKLRLELPVRPSRTRPPLTPLPGMPVPHTVLVPHDDPLSHTDKLVVVRLSLESRPFD